MSRYVRSKNRIARRFGANIFGRKRNPLLHKPNPPGVHGKMRRKMSDYGLQLFEKQKLKAVYGMIREKQLVNYYRKAHRQAGNTAINLLRLLECRLDVVVYRLGIAPTIFAAHQLVAHGHIQVDGKKVDIRSFQVKPGMIISVREKSRTMESVKTAIESVQEVPPYLSLNKESFSGQLVALPEVDNVPLTLEINLAEICDFLAHTT